jgi:hypothetical protein
LRFLVYPELAPDILMGRIDHPEGTNRRVVRRLAGAESESRKQKKNVGPVHGLIDVRSQGWRRVDKIHRKRLARCQK